MVLNEFSGGGSIGSTVYYRGETHRSLYYNFKNITRSTIGLDVQYVLTPEFRITVIWP